MKENSEKEKNSKMRDIIGMIIYCLVIIGVMYLIITYVGQRTVVVGHSMETTLQDGDNLITDKLTYRFKDPKRYDIIVFPFKDNTGKLLIKRIIGMPGETVQIKEGHVYINGMQSDEHYCSELIEEPGLALNPIELQDDEYFVLGDNRNASQDSRYISVGNVKREDIIGRAWLRIWPLNKFSLLKHQ